MRGIASERMQDLLNYWEDACYFYETGLDIAELVGAQHSTKPPMIQNWRDYRALLFDNSTEHLSLSDWGLSSEGYKLFPELGVRDTFPFEFFAWTRKSRRVFNLPKTLQWSFAQATFPKIRWDDVTLPYNSFIITLEEPLLVEDAEGVWSRYDTILVSCFPEINNAIKIRLMCEAHTVPERRRFPTSAVRRTGKHLKKGDYIRALEGMERAWLTMGRRLKSSPGWRNNFLRHAEDPQSSKIAVDVEDLLKTVSDQHIQSLEGGAEEARWRIAPNSFAAKIVISWCLYLETLSSSDLSWKTQRENRHQKGTRGITGVITNMEHVCTVLGRAAIDPFTYGLRRRPEKEGSTFFQTPHWRRAHKRREPGLPLTAPKTVKVPTYFVRGDLMPPHGIIGGTETDVLPDDD